MNRKSKIKKPAAFHTPQEFRLFDGNLMAVRSTGRPFVAERPPQLANYWQRHIRTSIDLDREHLVAVLLNTRRRVIGHHLVSIGTVDTVLMCGREVFRAAVGAAAHGIVIMHNHPSGSVVASEADIALTQQMILAGDLLGIDLVDHVIVGQSGRKHSSLRSLGWFARKADGEFCTKVKLPDETHTRHFAMECWPGMKNSPKCGGRRKSTTENTEA